MHTIPKEMKALQINQYHDDITEALRGLHVAALPVPKPTNGQVLIKIEAAPCNPSDLLLLQGHYGRKKTLPTVPGLEGAGTVVANGGGLLGRWLLGKRVACAVRSDISGTWAQYVVADAKACISLRDDVDFEQGSTLIVNPLTAVGLVGVAKKGGHAAIIQTAAASQLGKMVLTLANEANLPIINIVRRKEQEVLLRELGAKYVLNSESENFHQELKSEAARLKATVAFDAIAGRTTGEILSAMPNKSKILVYGALSGTSCSEISPMSLIFQEKSVEGFWLSSWLASKNIWGLYKATSTVQKLLASGAFHTSVKARVTLEEAPQALAQYQKEMTAGKVIIKPQ